MAQIAILAVLFVFLITYLASSVRIVRPSQRGVVERLGRFKGTAEPGLRFIIPFVDKLRLVDMREQVVDVPPQEVITSDNVVVSVDAVVYYEPVDRNGSSITSPTFCWQSPSWRRRTCATLSAICS